MSIQSPTGQIKIEQLTKTGVLKKVMTLCQSFISLGVWRPHYVASFSAWAELSSGSLLNVQLSSFFFFWILILSFEYKFLRNFTINKDGINF